MSEKFENYETKIGDKVESILFQNGVFLGHVAQNTATFELRDELVGLIGYFFENREKFFEED